MRIAILLVLLSSLAGADSLSDALAALRAAAPGDRAKAVEAVLALKPALEEVRKRLKAGVAMTAIEAGWRELSANGRPFEV